MTNQEKSEAIKNYRKAHRITQVELSAHLGYTSSVHINQIESGKTPVSDEAMKSIIKAINELDAIAIAKANEILNS